MLISVELGAWVPLIVEMATGQFRVYMENSMMRNWLLGFVAIQVIGRRCLSFCCHSFVPH